MLNLKRDNLGFICLNEEDCDFDKGNVIYIDGIKYFYKDSVEGAYKELFIEELAKDFGIKCAHYDLASFTYRTGVVSRDLNTEHNKFVPMYEILSDFYKATSYKTIKQYNNLDDIGLVLEQLFPNETYQKLLSQLEDLYLFDILIGNSDRNSTNYGLVYNGNDVDIVILDNELSMDTDVMYENKYQLKRTKTESEPDISYDKLQEGIKLIGNDSINSIFDRIEHKIHSTINEGIKCKFNTFFATSRTVLSKKIPKQSVKYNQNMIG